MFIVTERENEIAFIAEEKEIQDNGYPVYTEKGYGKTAVPPEFIVGEYEVAETDIPSEVERYKYCYTPEKGFYKNPNWKEPKEPLEDRMNIIEERVALAEDMINMSLGF